MKKIFLLISGLVMLTSCKEIPGNLQVFEPFVVKAKNECGWNPFVTCAETKDVKLVSENYEAVLDFSSKNDFKLSLKGKNFKETVVFSQPKYFSIPENGKFDLTAEEISQDFLLEGDVKTYTYESERRSGYESCMYTVTDYICNYQPNGGTFCGPVPRQVWGQQFVVYTILTTQKTISANFLNNEHKLLGKFSGHREDAEKNYQQKGFCH